MSNGTKKIVNDDRLDYDAQNTSSNNSKVVLKPKVTLAPPCEHIEMMITQGACYITKTDKQHYAMGVVTKDDFYNFVIQDKYDRVLLTGYKIRPLYLEVCPICGKALYNHEL